MLDISNKHKNILVICDQPRILAETKRELGIYFDVDIASNDDIAVSILSKSLISAIIFCLPENHKSAFSSYPEVLIHAQALNIPVIYLAEKGNDIDESIAFEIGAADYTVRRQGTVGALVNRICLRIRAGENEQALFNNIQTSISQQTAPDSELQSADAEQSIKLSTEENKEASVSVLNGKTIIIADDVEINRSIIAYSLADIEGLKLEFAENGKQVINYLQRDPEIYSLILMDVYMPEMSGLEATGIIRNMENEKAKTIPIIAATADVGESEIALYLESGMNGYIEKPMNYEEMVSLLTKFCS